MKGFICSSLICVFFLSACAPHKTPEIQNSEKSRLAPNTPLSHAKLKKNETSPVDQSTVFSKNGRQDANDTASKKIAANAPNSFIISGAIAGRTPKKAWNASINWMQRGAGTYQIRLYGPLGSGNILVSKQGGQVQLRDGNTVSSAASADTLLRNNAGITLPVQSLYYWVRGIPAPGSVQSIQKDSSGRITLLQQSGYTIRYLGYTQALGRALPSHIKLDGNSVSIKLIIKQWSA